MDNKIAVSITFDDNNQIRVLDSEKFRDTENLKGECIDFLKSTVALCEVTVFCVEIMNFNDMVGTLIDVLDSQAKKIEEEKLKVFARVPDAATRLLERGTELKAKRTLVERRNRSSKRSLMNAEWN